MEIGTAIKTLRKKKGYSQEYLANKCGLSVNTISLIETNLTFPKESTIKNICRTLGHKWDRSNTSKPKTITMKFITYYTISGAVWAVICAVKYKDISKQEGIVGDVVGQIGVELFVLINFLSDF
jgi:transcriptional regulator with XRE-family HTH domain